MSRDERDSSCGTHKVVDKTGDNTSGDNKVDRYKVNKDPDVTTKTHQWIDKDGNFGQKETKK